MLLYVHDVFPERCQKHSTDELREVIRYGIELAGSYGVESDDCVERYIHLMFMLGVHFDEDPRYPWAQPILRNEDLSEEEAMQALTDEACGPAPGEPGHRSAKRT